MDQDIRWKQRYSNFKKAALQLDEFVNKTELNKFEVQGLIQCFEYTFELAWKTMKDYLEYNGLTVNSPRKAIQTAFQNQLVADGHAWIDALEKRNLMSHTYNEDTARQAEELIRKIYYHIIMEFCATLEEKL